MLLKQTADIATFFTCVRGNRFFLFAILHQAIMSPVNKQSPFAAHGISHRDARTTVRRLKAAVRAADKQSTNSARHYAVENAIHDFRESAYGKLAWHLLHRDGHVLVPLFSSSDVADKTSQMHSSVVESLLAKNDEGKHVVSERVLKAEPRITGETRFMIKPGRLGKEFVSRTREMADTLSSVLLAIAYGAYELVEMEHPTVLLNNENVKKQLLHRDYNGEDIDANMGGMIGRGSRSRPQAPPFSALCAFQDNTHLHAIDGSHLNPSQTNFNSNQAKACHIPTGYACVFQAGLVHSGMGSVGLYHARVHMYLKTKGTPHVYRGTIQVVTDDADA